MVTSTCQKWLPAVVEEVDDRIIRRHMDQPNRSPLEKEQSNILIGAPLTLLSSDYI